MKTRTAEAARSLGLHPTVLLLYLAEAGVTAFDDAWPEVDEVWLTAIRQKHWDRFLSQRKPAVSLAGIEPRPKSAVPALSEEAALVLEKLWRKKKWGAVRVTVEALSNMVHLPASALDGTLEELQARRLVLRHADQYSLDPSRSSEIERLAKDLTHSA